MNYTTPLSGVPNVHKTRVFGTHPYRVDLKGAFLATAVRHDKRGYQA
jgi:hypothetical protein